MDTERTNLVKMGKYISYLRKKNNMTQQQIADFLDVSNKSVSKWENGDVAPDITILRPLAVLLGVDVDELLNGEPITDNSYISQISKRISRKRTKKIMILLLIIFSIILFLLYIIGNHLKYHVIEMTNPTDNKYYVHAYIVKNNKSVKIMIDEFSIKNDVDSLNLKEFELSLYSNDKHLLKTFKRNNITCILQDCIIGNNLFYVDDNYKDSYDLSKINIVIKYSLDGIDYNFINIVLQK